MNRARNLAAARPKGKATVTLILVALLFSGCTGIGPRTIARDRLDYVSAISESWKRQTLLNLVKTRYLDAPVFLDVASVINQYSLEHEVDVGVSGKFSNRGDPNSVSPDFGVKGVYTDRPTITYNPLLGENFARTLLKPIPNAAILLLAEAGYPIDHVLRTCVQAINGLENRRSRGLAYRPADPEFYELLILLRRLQDMEAFVIRAQSLEGREILSVLFKPSNEAFTAVLEGALQLLGLDPDAREFRLVTGAFSTNNREIAMLGRSMLQIFSAYASWIDVPESHVSQGRVYAPEQDDFASRAGFPALIQVRSGTEKPGDAYVDVRYRDHWFWIDDRDMHSKNTFHFLMIMFFFSERGESGQTVPIVTVPTN